MNRESLLKILTPGAHVVVCGLGITGIETGLFLRRSGFAVTCSEKLSRQQYVAKDKFGRLAELEESGVTLQFGVDGEGIASCLVPDSTKLAVLSPGVNLASSLVGALRRRAVPFITELEFGVALAGVPVIMVTGSNGKSTTVSLIHHLLQSLGLRSLLCGNVGTPVVAEFRAGELESGLKARFDWMVVEASSYQLEACTTLAPDVGVLLNLSDNHLERHGSMERYREAKLSMVMRQGANQKVVVNRDDRWFGEVIPRLPGEVFTFGESSSSKHGGKLSARVLGNFVDVFTANEGRGPLRFDAATTQLLGEHNVQNIAAALTAIAAAGVDISPLQKSLDTFSPLEHRLEFVAEYRGARILNDSKSTTVAASVAALRAVAGSGTDGRIVLCLGGAAKAGSWSPLIDEIKRCATRVGVVLCFGQDGEMIRDQLLSGLERSWEEKVRRSAGVKATVSEALALLSPGDLLLFSPACASFDEFSDFEHRGREFKRFVSEASRKTGE
jgi:UDP-N-acetylmuramoylalanine--D-glutamate ligase